MDTQYVWNRFDVFMRQGKRPAVLVPKTDKQSKSPQRRYLSVDWMSDVAAGETILDYKEWIRNKISMEDENR
jgi:hypothetical protein